MKLSNIKKLQQKKYRAQYACYLVEGEHLVLELDKALTVNAQSSSKKSEDFVSVPLYVSRPKLKWAQNLSKIFDVIELTDKQILDISDTKSPQGVVACVPFDVKLLRDKTKQRNKRYIYLHEIQDPGNLGTILRTLAWFDGFNLLMSPNSVDPYNPKVVRASMGAIFHVEIEQNVRLQDVATRFDRFAYLDINGTNINTDGFGNFDCYLFGNEARGVPVDELKNVNAKAYTIKGCGQIESLNLASALNMCMYELHRG